MNLIKKLSVLLLLSFTSQVTLAQSEFLVDTNWLEQNINDPNYIPMSPSFDGLAFKAAYNLIFEGKNQPSGYTEPILHETRLKLKNLA